MPTASAAATPPTVAPASEAVAPNYQWWRENGAGWGEEYDRRERAGVKYHISKFILCDYAFHTAPARVLEFGCGPGRHLRYLSTLPGVDIHGYEQSSAMASGIRRWASPAWFDAHVTIGPPTGALPYPDGAFDFAYTASVLVHVRPEDLPGVLRELIRVSGGHVIHLEPRSRATAYCADHDGCWTHDLVGAYRSIGHRCVDLTAGHHAPAVFRVLADGVEAAHTPSPVLLGLYQRMTDDLSPTT